jgi:hypothetical protein
MIAAKVGDAMPAVRAREVKNIGIASLDATLTLHGAIRSFTKLASALRKISSGDVCNAA